MIRVAMNDVTLMTDRFLDLKGCEYTSCLIWLLYTLRTILRNSIIFKNFKILIFNGWQRINAVCPRPGWLALFGGGLCSAVKGDGLK